MQWADVLADPTLRNLPYKIELDHHGRIVMSPASNRHDAMQARLGPILAELLVGGALVNECSIETTGGVRVADVVWVSPALLARHGLPTPLPVAPDLCVEIVSPSNTRAELAEKTALYLEAGAREVWLVREDGALTAFGPEGERTRSTFPEIELDRIVERL